MLMHSYSKPASAGVPIPFGLVLTADFRIYQRRISLAQYTSTIREKIRTMASIADFEFTENSSPLWMVYHKYYTFHPYELEQLPAVNSRKLQ
jgi:hypothetical protein